MRSLTPCGPVWPSATSARPGGACGASAARPQFDDAEPASGPSRIKLAAVLVPIVLHPQPSILLTLRAAKMSAHAGQVSFPGGRIEAGETPGGRGGAGGGGGGRARSRGCRNCWGGCRNTIPAPASTSPRCVALVPPPLNLVADPREVEEPFELPLSVILDPHAPERRTAEWKGRTRNSGSGRMSGTISGGRPRRSWSTWPRCCAGIERSSPQRPASAGGAPGALSWHDATPVMAHRCPT